MRVESGEGEADAGGLVAAKFAGSGRHGRERAQYWPVEIPYRPFYAYEETLATSRHAGCRRRAAAFERLTTEITRR